MKREVVSHFLEQQNEEAARNKDVDRAGFENGH